MTTLSNAGDGVDDDAGDGVGDDTLDGVDDDTIDGVGDDTVDDDALKSVCISGWQPLGPIWTGSLAHRLQHCTRPTEEVPILEVPSEVLPILQLPSGVVPILQVPTE